MAVDPPRVSYRAAGRLPDLLGDALAARQARRLVRALHRRRGRPRVVVLFDPLQYPLARAVLAAAGEPCELWYHRGERAEADPSARPAVRARAERLHERAAERAALTFASSTELVRQEGLAGHRALLVAPAADGFPAPDPNAESGGPVVAVALGPFGAHTDWALLRGAADALGDRLVLLLVGERDDRAARRDADHAACLEHPSLVWLGPHGDAATARLVLAADVALAPLRHDPFADAAAPVAILQAARLGRRTVTPDLAGVRTWERAVVAGDGAPAVAAALARFAGARASPDAELRAWALAQTARTQDEPLWERLADAGVDVRVTS